MPAPAFQRFWLTVLSYCGVKPARISLAAVVGGCLLTGGFGSVVGASVGALIYGMTNLGITYAGWNVDWLKTFLGIMLVLATLINMWVRRQAERR